MRGGHHGVLTSQRQPGCFSRKLKRSSRLLIPPRPMNRSAHKTLLQSRKHSHEEEPSPERLHDPLRQEPQLMSVCKSRESAPSMPGRLEDSRADPPAEDGEGEGEEYEEGVKEGEVVEHW